VLFLLFPIDENDVLGTFLIVAKAAGGGTMTQRVSNLGRTAVTAIVRVLVVLSLTDMCELRVSFWISLGRYYCWRCAAFRSLRTFRSYQQALHLRGMVRRCFGNDGAVRPEMTDCDACSGIRGRCVKMSLRNNTAGWMRQFLKLFVSKSTLGFSSRWSMFLPA
jgi:hypothetical protein